MLYADALAGLTFFANGLSDSFELERHLFVCGDNLVEIIGDFSGESRPRYGKADAEVAFFHSFEALQDGGKALRHRWFQYAHWIAVISILPAEGRFNCCRHPWSSWVGSGNSAFSDRVRRPLVTMYKRTNAGLQRADRCIAEIGGCLLRVFVANF